MYPSKEPNIIMKYHLLLHISVYISVTCDIYRKLNTKWIYISTRDSVEYNVISYHMNRLHDTMYKLKTFCSCLFINDLCKMHLKCLLYLRITCNSYTLLLLGVF